MAPIGVKCLTWLSHSEPLFTASVRIWHAQTLCSMPLFGHWPIHREWVCARHTLAQSMAGNRGWGKLVAQSQEGLFYQVVAESSAYQESCKVDRLSAQQGKSGWAANKVDAEKKLLP